MLVVQLQGRWMLPLLLPNCDFAPFIEMQYICLQCADPQTAASVQTIVRSPYPCGTFATTSNLLARKQGLPAQQIYVPHLDGVCSTPFCPAAFRFFLPCLEGENSPLFQSSRPSQNNASFHILPRHRSRVAHVGRRTSGHLFH